MPSAKGGLLEIPTLVGGVHWNFVNKFKSDNYNILINSSDSEDDLIDIEL